MNVVKVHVTKMVASSFKNSRYESNDVPKCACEYAGEMEFGGTTFNFKMHPDTYKKEHRFTVVGLDLETLEKVGTKIDFSEAIAIFETEYAAYEKKLTAYNEAKYKATYNKNPIVVNKMMFENSGYVITSMEEYVKNTYRNVCATKNIVNTFDIKDTETITIKVEDNGTFDVHLDYNHKSSGRIKNVERALSKANELINEWHEKNARINSKKEYKNLLIDHVQNVFAAEEVEANETFSRGFRNKVYSNGTEFTVATTEENCHNGKITVKPSKQSDETYLYTISSTIEFDEADAIKIVNLMKEILAKQDAATKAEKAAKNVENVA